MAEQIDILADFIMANIEGEPSKREGAGDCAIRIIINLQSQLEDSRWVPVAERLPENGKDYEFVVPAFSKIGLQHGTWIGFEGERFVECETGHTIELKDITHFRPITLPKTPDAKN